MKTLLKLFILLTLVSCNKSEINNSTDQSVRCMSDIQLDRPKSVGEYDSRRFDTDAKLVKKGAIVIVSDNVEVTKSQITSILKKCNGYSTFETLNSDQNGVSYKLVFQVPANNFDQFIRQLDSLQLKITERTLFVKDVSMEYIDETTRLENKRKLEAKYIDILTKAKTVDDIIKINSTIEELRSDIESREAQLKKLDCEVAVSEFNITISKTPVVAEKSRGSHHFDTVNRFKEALLDGVEGVNVWMEFMISIWPLYILFTILFFVGRYSFKRYQKWIIGKN